MAPLFGGIQWYNGGGVKYGGKLGGYLLPPITPISS